MSLLPQLKLFIHNLSSFKLAKTTEENVAFVTILQLYLIHLKLRYMHGGTELSKQVAPELPPVSVVDLYQKASLFIKFNDIGFETPRPSMPDIVSVGHSLVRAPKPLPGHIEEILTKSKGIVNIFVFVAHT